VVDEILLVPAQARLHLRLRHQALHRHQALQDHQLTDAEEEIEEGIDEDHQSEEDLHRRVEEVAAEVRLHVVVVEEVRLLDEDHQDVDHHHQEDDDLHHSVVDQEDQCLPDEDLQ